MNLDRLSEHADAAMQMATFWFVECNQNDVQVMNQKDELCA
jgi:hypothetical protein